MFRALTWIVPCLCAHLNRRRQPCPVENIRVAGSALATAEPPLENVGLAGPALSVTEPPVENIRSASSVLSAPEPP